MYAFSFRVQQGYSRYSITDGQTHREIIAGYHGLIYADQETKSVMRIIVECDSIPTDFPVQQVSVTLDYDFTKIGDREFLLPLKIRHAFASRKGPDSWNETEFRPIGSSEPNPNITFDAAEPARDKPLDKIAEWST